MSIKVLLEDVENRKHSHRESNHKPLRKSKWKSSVRVCARLFLRATRSTESITRATRSTESITQNEIIIVDNLSDDFQEGFHYNFPRSQTALH